MKLYNAECFHIYFILFITEPRVLFSSSHTSVNWFIIFFCYVLVAFSFPFSLFFCLKIVSNYETLVVFRLGKLQPPKGPGPTILLPCIDQ